MKNTVKNLFAILLLAVLTISVNPVLAGNEDRAGEAGASELLIMPFARSSGWGMSNTSSIRGLEGMYLNVAGTAFTKSTEVMFARTEWLKGSGISVNSFGLTQKVGESGVIGLGVMTMGFGDIMITTVDLPEGGIGTFKPSFMNIGISYAKAFSNSIYGGLVLKVISESISDNRAQGVAIDAGIQYLTGDNENIHFGIALRNIGPTMKYTGDGLSFRGNVNNSDVLMTVEQRSVSFQLPALLNIGAAYDFIINDAHTITLAGSFTSMSFGKDLFAGGLQYNFNDYLMLRGGLQYEKGMFDSNERTSAYTGPTAGVTIQVPLNKEKGSTFSLDYSYRTSNPFQGTHCIGARINL
ncbi:MAG: hypothetical protein A2W93_08035 [Bacteroidetes bacterium GWF2_43_63]|nr:MAG: hypothetical protein A2W94_04690 [Bacteroidetes bacterium GWE2_42_42]OFY55563.1 MAG: hypothetical protein A2W93_08035 [Bacteroidetes bacterium GWF2_43_63]HCB62108.1 DUF3308 domain-containing protein [Bacteroidales bacterium]HCY22336.1 DUF3308 domain-containing protein [Bacteroidales bacterium]